jgi:hypothetical protein
MMFKYIKKRIKFNHEGICHQCVLTGKQYGMKINLLNNSEGDFFDRLPHDQLNSKNCPTNKIRMKM